MKCCRENKLFRNRPAGRAGPPKNLRIGHGGPGQLIFLNFMCQDGPWHCGMDFLADFGQGGPGQWELTSHNHNSQCSE